MLASSGSGLERDADEVSVAPYQSALSDGPKIVKRKIKFYRQDVQPFQANARTGICYVAHTTRKNTGLAAEK